MLGPIAHLAVWAAMYVAAAVVCASQLMGIDDDLTATALVYAWSTALLAYLLDRVKLRDAWLDPADARAHPERFAFLVAHRHAARLVMLGAAMVSAWAGWRLHPVAVVGTGLTIAGVLLYAGTPRHAHARPRVKDRFILKNLFVGVGIAGFAVPVAGLGAAQGAGSHGAAAGADLVARVLSHPALAPAPIPLSGLVFAYLTLRVYADAVLCDIDDEDSDRAHDTRTLPTRLGAEPAWRAAMCLRLALAASLLFWPLGPFAARAAWAAISAAGTILLRWWRPTRVRDLVDARFGVEAVGVWAVLTLVA